MPRRPLKLGLSVGLVAVAVGALVLTAAGMGRTVFDRMATPSRSRRPLRWVQGRPEASALVSICPRPPRPQPPATVAAQPSVHRGVPRRCGDDGDGGPTTSETSHSRCHRAGRQDRAVGSTRDRERHRLGHVTGHHPPPAARRQAHPGHQGRVRRNRAPAHARQRAAAGVGPSPGHRAVKADVSADELDAVDPVTIPTVARSIGMVCAVVALGLGLAASLQAQFGRGFGSVRVATPQDFDGRFHFCRLVYRGGRGGGGSWQTDFPRADINMSIRLSELTKTKVSVAAGYPNHLLVRPTDDTLFQCPFLIMAAPGSASLDDRDAVRLREYLLKGGFIWADDFWGSFQWEQWVVQLRKVLPANQYAVVDIPLDHPMLRSQFVVTEIPQIPNIGFFMRSGGGTSEQGADSAVPHAAHRVRQRRPHHDADDPQHRYLGLVGARGRRPQLLLCLRPPGLRVRNKRAALCDVALRATSMLSIRAIVCCLLLAATFTATMRADGPGVLLLAHGGSAEWNAHVTTLAEQVNRTRPTEVAFGMATRATHSSCRRSPPRTRRHEHRGRAAVRLVVEFGDHLH